MKQFFITLFITTLATAGFAQQTVFNDANAQKRDVQSFHAINISNAIDLFLSQGNEDAVAVSAGDVKYRDNIRTEVNDGVLRISYVNTGRRWSIGHTKLPA